jgi:RimJ/RimL family protein N-acetyltransferase
LRPITVDDVDLLVDLDSDPEVMRYLTGRPSTRLEIETVIRDRLGWRWIATERLSGAFVGWFGLVPGREDSYDIGYRLGRMWWGRGLASEGAKALMDAAFRVMQARRVTAQTRPICSDQGRNIRLMSLGRVHAFLCNPEMVVRGGRRSGRRNL